MATLALVVAVLGAGVEPVVQAASSTEIAAADTAAITVTAARRRVARKRVA
ncbi:hypothetical protein [Subtercola endophyticus]|uniref:hypothetical protein n=1 Tax=Subtercola endophyticus TaxID=2895559 RepID=UPI001E532B8B|nr:hypothetical protein [Subtercola endophyticus]UFS60893.1 hypothetical protein LQ955_09240 [Subtercola endophyticus]